MGKIGRMSAVWLLCAAAAGCAEPPVPPAPVCAERVPCAAAGTLLAAEPAPPMIPALLPPGTETELFLRDAVRTGESEDGTLRWILYDSYAEAAGFSASYLAEHVGGEAAVRIPAHCGELPVCAVADEAFSGDCGVMLTEVILPDGLYVIGSRAFYGQSTLMLVEIPDSVLRIGEAAFATEHGDAVPLISMGGAIFPAGADEYVNEKMYDAAY